MIWCYVELRFVFDVANAFDREDGIASKTMFESGGGGLDALGRFELRTVDPKLGRVERRMIDKTPQGFPRIDERHFGQSYRFAYSVSVPPDGNTQLIGATSWTPPRTR